MAKRGRGFRARKVCPVGSLTNNPASAAQVRVLGNFVRDHLLDPMVTTFIARRGGLAMEEALEQVGVKAGGMRGIEAAIQQGTEGGALLDDTYRNLATDDSLLLEIVRRALLPHTPEGRDALRLASGDAARSYRFAGSANPNMAARGIGENLGGIDSLRDVGERYVPWNYTPAQGPVPQTRPGRVYDQDFASDKALRDAFSVEGIDLAPADLHRMLETDVWRTHLTYEDKRQVLDTLVSGQFSLPLEQEIVQYLKKTLQTDPRKLVTLQWHKLRDANKARKKFARKRYAEQGHGRPKILEEDRYLGTDARLLWEEALQEDVRRARGLNEGQGGVHRTIKNLVDRYAIDDVTTYDRRTGALGWKQALYETSEDGFDPAVLGEAVQLGKHLDEFAQLRTAALPHLDPNEGITEEGLRLLKRQAPEVMAHREAEGTVGRLLRDLEREQPIDPKVMASLYNMTLSKAQGLYPLEQDLQDFLMVALLRQTGMEPRQMARLRIRHTGPDGFILDPGRKKGGFEPGGKPLSVSAREIRVGDDVTGALARLFAHRQQNVPEWAELSNDLFIFRNQKDRVWTPVTQGQAGKIMGGWRARLAAQVSHDMKEAGLQNWKVTTQDLGVKNFRRLAIARANTPYEAASILGHADAATTVEWYWGKGKSIGGWHQLSQKDYNPARIHERNGRLVEVFEDGTKMKGHDDDVVPLDAIDAELQEASESFLDAVGMGQSPGRAQERLRAQIEEELALYSPRVQRLMHELGMIDDPTEYRDLVERGVRPFVQLEEVGANLPQHSMGIGRQGLEGGGVNMERLQARLAQQGPTPRTRRTPEGVEVAPPLPGERTPFQQRVHMAAATPASGPAGGMPRWAGTAYATRLRQTARDRAVAKGHLDPTDAKIVEDITAESDPRAWEAIEREMDGLRAEGFTEEFGQARPVIADGQGYRLTVGASEGFGVPYGLEAAPSVQYRTAASKAEKGRQLAGPEAVAWADPDQAEGYFRFFENAIADADPDLLRAGVNRINASFQEALDRGLITDPTMLQRFWTAEGSNLRNPILYRYVVGEEARILGKAFEQQFEPLMTFLAAQKPAGALHGPGLRSRIAQAIKGQSSDPTRPAGLGRRFTKYKTKKGDPFPERVTGEIHAHRVSQGFNAMAGELRQEAIRETEDLVRVLSGKVPTIQADAIGDIQANLVSQAQIRGASLESPAIFDAVSKIAEDRFIKDKGKTRDNLSAAINFMSVLLPMVTLPGLAADALGVGE